MADVRAAERSIDKPVLAPLVDAARRGARPIAVAPRHWLLSAIRWVDASIRRAEGIIDFSDNPGCVLRIAVRRTDCAVRLHDGEIPAGSKFVELHLYNDHLIKDDTHGLKWGTRFRKRLVASLAELAEALQRDPQFHDVRAVRGRLASPLDRRRAELARFAARFGFEPLGEDHRKHWTDSLHDLGENIWLVILGLAFGTQAHEHRSLLRWRGDVWISRGRLVERFGPGRARDASQGQGRRQGEGPAAQARSA